MTKLGLTGKLIARGDHGECAACTSPATHFVNVDGPNAPIGSYRVCARHESMARSSFDRFLKHIATKVAFVDDPDAEKARVRERREKEG